MMAGVIKGVAGWAQFVVPIALAIFGAHWLWLPAVAAVIALVGMSTDNRAAIYIRGGRAHLLPAVWATIFALTLVIQVVIWCVARLIVGLLIG